MGDIFLLFLIVIAIAVAAGAYLLPTIIAFSRKKENKISILLLNALLGWSLIAWVVALVWATSKDAQPQQVIIHNSTVASEKESATK